MRGYRRGNREGERVRGERRDGGECEREVRNSSGSVSRWGKVGEWEWNANGVGSKGA